MARQATRPEPARGLDLPALTRTCPACGGALRAACKTRRSVTSLDGVIRLGVQVRRCRDRQGPRSGVPLRSEQEGRFVLPRHQFGLDVIATVGALRHAQHRSLPEIHAERARRGIAICVRSVGNPLDRYDELPAPSCSDAARLRRVTSKAGRVIPAIDGLRPDVGHEVLRVIRDVLSGEVLLARSPLSPCRDDLAKLPREVKATPEVPIAGAISDGRTSIRKAAAEASKGVPHQLCHFHHLREAATPVYEADRHAEVQPTKKVRGIRPIGREVEGRQDGEADVIRGDCAAVRSASTDDDRPPPGASGLKLRDRPAKVAARPDRVNAKRGPRRS